jgi:hypothetical protein
MDNRTVLEQVEKGYRMPRPNGYNIDCPTSLYEIMLETWNRVPERRPTFEHLKATFEAFFIATEASYKESV